METYYVKEVFSRLKQNYLVQDEQGHTHFMVEPKIGQGFILSDSEGTRLAQVRSPRLGKRPGILTFEVYQDGVLNATIQRCVSLSLGWVPPCWPCSIGCGPRSPVDSETMIKFRQHRFTVYPGAMPILSELPLSESLRERLTAMVEHSQRSEESILCEALEAQIERYELAQELLTLEEDIEAGREPLYSMEEAKAYVGLGD